MFHAENTADKRRKPASNLTFQTEHSTCKAPLHLSKAASEQGALVTACTNGHDATAFQAVRGTSDHDATAFQAVRETNDHDTTAFQAVRETNDHDATAFQAVRETNDHDTTAFQGVRETTEDSRELQGVLHGIDEIDRADGTKDRNRINTYDAWKQSDNLLLPNGNFKQSKYKLVQKLETGGFGEVWKAKDEHDDAYAVKKMKIPFDAKNILAEISHLKQRNHANIPKYVDSFQVDEKEIWLVMEYIQGMDISDLAYYIEPEYLAFCSYMSWGAICPVVPSEQENYSSGCEK